MNKTKNDLIAKQKAKNALVLNKVRPDASPVSNSAANKKDSLDAKVRK